MSGNGVVISIKGLRKSYGKFEALHGIDIEVSKGEIFGFLGPNGAGKTTTIRTLLDFIRPSGGSIKVFGLDSMKGSQEIHRRVGYLPGEIGYYMNLRGKEFLEYAGWDTTTTVPKKKTLKKLGLDFLVDDLA